MTASLYLQVCVTNAQLPSTKALKWRAEISLLKYPWNRQWEDEPEDGWKVCILFSSISLLWRAWVTMNSWNHCGNKCYIMYLSIKHVWMYFVKTNCNDMKGGRLLVYIDFFVAQSKQKNEAEKSLRMKSFCMHQYAFAFPRQPATAYTWRKYVLHRKSVWWVNWFYYPDCAASHQSAGRHDFIYSVNEAWMSIMWTMNISPVLQVQISL